ncbi:MAG: hypothetical protein ABI162_10320 [Luteolibacter sp.]
MFDVLFPSAPLKGRLKVGKLAARESKLTFYTRFGWLTPWIGLALALVCWIRMLVPVKRS